MRDDASGALFVFPLQADESRIPVDGRFAAWRSLDGGDSWSRSGKGWPEQPTYSGVLRARQRRTATAACTSAAPAAGCGQPPDAGNTWEALRGCYPRILALAIW